MTQSALLEFHNSREISKKDHPWKLKARVISLWNVPEHMLPLYSSSMDLVLIDREGMKFEASICKSHPILPKIVEDCVYQISFFRIIDNISPKRFTSTKYRLFFHACTKIYPVVDHKIPKNCWNFFHMDHIKYYGNTFGYLVDVVGILSAASSEKLLIKDSRIYKSMDIHLLDKSGMNKCFLVGDIVDTISEYLCSNWVTKPVVALLFVEVRKNNGATQVHVVPYVTKILINPKFEEDSVLADRFDGMNSNLHVDFISNADKKVDIHAELLELYPKKTIPELLLTKQKGIFVVHAGIVSLLKDSAFFYPSCRCFTELERGDDVYRCNRCFRVIEKFIHRYSFKLEVYDGVDSCVFLLKDREAVELIGISCQELMNSKENLLDREYPAELEDKIVGKELLLKIRAGFGITYNCQEIYEVLMISADSDIMQSFHSEKMFTTPLKAKFAPPFTQLQDVHDSTKVQEKHVGKHKYTCDVAARFNSGMNSSVVVGQSSSTTVIHSSLKRKLEAEFEPYVSEISDDLYVIESIMRKSINDRYGLKDEAEISGVKIEKSDSKKATIEVVLQNTAVVADEKLNGSKIQPNLESAEVVDLTTTEEEFEISPTQVATISESVDIIDLTKVNGDAEVSSKEFEVSSVQNVEEVEVWEVVDLST